MLSVHIVAILLPIRIGLSEEQDTVVLGEKDKYEPRCRLCYSMGNILNFKLKRTKTKIAYPLFLLTTVKTLDILKPK